MIKFSAITVPPTFILFALALSIFVPRTRSFRPPQSLSLFPFDPRFLPLTFSTILAPASIALPLLSFSRAPLPKSVECDAMDTGVLSSSTRAQTTNRPSFKYFQKESILQKYPCRAFSVMVARVLPNRERPKELAIKYMCIDAFTKSSGP